MSSPFLRNLQTIRRWWTGAAWVPSEQVPSAPAVPGRWQAVVDGWPPSAPISPPSPRSYKSARECERAVDRYVVHLEELGLHH